MVATFIDSIIETLQDSAPTCPDQLAAVDRSIVKACHFIATSQSTIVAIEEIRARPSPEKVGPLVRPYMLTGDEILLIINDLRKGD